MKKDDFSKYIEHTSDIRELSSPQINDIAGSGEYRQKLKQNFQLIGEIARENRKILEDVIDPLIRSDEELTPQDVQDITELSEQLVNTADLENLDISIMSLLSTRLMKDAEKKQDAEYIVRQLDSQINASYSLKLMTSRIFTDLSISQHFKDLGTEAWQAISVYLQPEKFEALSDEAKSLVLHSTRFHTVLHESSAGISPEVARAWLAELDNVVALCENPYYRQAFPSFDWNYYVFRTLENHSGLLDSLYGGELSQEDVEKIAGRLERWLALWQSDPAIFEKFAPLDFVLIPVYRARYLTGKISRAEYLTGLYEIYSRRNRYSYTYDDVYINTRIPLNYLLCAETADFTAQELDTLQVLYQDVCNYAFRMPNSGTLTALLDFCSVLIKRFIEVPGSITFQEMCLNLLAAFHPPTYVHSVTVANLTKCISSHLIYYRPELFIGICDCKTVEEVTENRNRIMQFAYNAGLCHDFGKTLLTDIIFIYGRKLLDFEFDIVKQHPSLGGALMRLHPSTQPYAEVAEGHHKWYDNSAGYPETLDTSQCKLKTIIDIVNCADCMDAATDTVGRSYNIGKTLDDFLAELHAGAGTRYSPYLSELLTHQEVRDDLDYLLAIGRQNNYQNTYLLLKRVQTEAEHEKEAAD